MTDLREQRLQISEFSDDMNDPFDLRGALLNNHPDLQGALIKQLSKFGVMCFSQNWTHPMLWSHYADKHRDFV
jgi:hypothetical protein